MKILSFLLLAGFMAAGVSGAGVTAAQAAVVPVDLSSGWVSNTKSGSANWTIQPGNDAVYQTVNGEPTVFYATGVNAKGAGLSGKISVKTTSDDDFIGFVLGYNDNEIFSSAADFILVDWKKNTQALNGGPGPRGLAISHVTDAANGDFWNHDSGVTELKRGTNLGDAGWVSNVTYDFDLVFTSSLIEVFVNGIKEISLTASEAGLASFGDGSFGFYNYSQANVLYSALEQREVEDPNPNPNEVPVPGALSLLALGLGALSLRRRRI